MKNIVIVGTPRSGKTTFAKMIMKKFSNYNLIEEDTIKCAYENALVDEAARHSKGDSLSVTLSDKTGTDIAKYTFLHSIKFNPELNHILCTYSLSLEEAKKLADDGNIVLVFGFPKLSKEEILHNIITYDTVQDWTYIEPEWRLMMYAKSFLKESIEDEKECKKYHLKFVDTSYNREQVLEELLKWLENEPER